MNKIALLVFFVINFYSFSQTKEEALKDAKNTANATLKMDFETVIKHTLPAVVELMGGKDAALKLLKNTFNKMKEEGFVFEKAEILNVSKNN